MLLLLLFFVPNREWLVVNRLTQKLIAHLSSALSLPLLRRVFFLSHRRVFFLSRRRVFFLISDVLAVVISTRSSSPPIFFRHLAVVASSSPPSFAEVEIHFRLCLLSVSSRTTQESVEAPALLIRWNFFRSPEHYLVTFGLHIPLCWDSYFNNLVRIQKKTVKER